jgi:polyphosphate kinase
MLLEHSRVWYFYNNGKKDIFLSSADWMKRNLYRRIETAFPVLDKRIKKTGQRENPVFRKKTLP